MCASEPSQASTIPPANAAPDVAKDVIADWAWIELFAEALGCDVRPAAVAVAISSLKAERDRAAAEIGRLRGELAVLRVQPRPAAIGLPTRMDEMAGWVVTNQMSTTWTCDCPCCGEPVVSPDSVGLTELITCGECKAAFYVDGDGNPEPEECDE